MSEPFENSPGKRLVYDFIRKLNTLPTRALYDAGPPASVGTVPHGTGGASGVPGEQYNKLLRDFVQQGGTTEDFLRQPMFFPMAAEDLNRELANPNSEERLRTLAPSIYQGMEALRPSALLRNGPRRTLTDLQHAAQGLQQYFSPDYVKTVELPW